VLIRKRDAEVPEILTFLFVWEDSAHFT